MRKMTPIWRWGEPVLVDDQVLGISKLLPGPRLGPGWGGGDDLAARPCFQRSGERELLDGPTSDIAELRENLNDIYRLNRLIGTTNRLVRSVTGLLAGVDAPLQVLDVGTGSADIPIALVRWARKSGRAIRVTALDLSPQVIAIAQERVTAYPEIELIEGDARRLPFRAGSYHAAVCSLMLHHLDESDAVTLLRNLDHVTSRGFVVSDLTRGWTAYWSTWLLIHALMRNRLTRHDGPLSVKRAYTLAEMCRLLEEAGVQSARVSHAFPWKATIVQDKWACRWRTMVR
jgi:ubiquinone/menaquinone biosynthesis C-methylase UbiE